MTKLSETAVTSLTNELFLSRQSRKTLPEGKFDQETGFWYPTDREDQEGTQEVKPPSPPWPHSYLIHCRSRKHCRLLIERAVAGKDVPPDVLEVVTRPVASVYIERSPKNGTLIDRNEVKRIVREALRAAGLDRAS